MILYTVQTKEVLAAIYADGCVYPDVAKENDNFKDPYNWMRGKMVERGILHNHARGMFWTHPNRQDMEYMAGVLLTLDVPDNLILPSDHDDWHCVLNNGPIVKDDENFEQEYDRLCLPENKHELIKSWDNCLGKMNGGKIEGNPDFHNEKTTWQCTIPYIHAIQVLSVIEDFAGGKNNV